MGEVCVYGLGSEGGGAGSEGDLGEDVVFGEFAGMDVLGSV